MHNEPMPLFEYACRSCGHKFEFLTRAGHAPTCPACTSVELEKQLSVFAVRAPSSGLSSSMPAPTGACGMCGDPRGPGACSMN
jgi:putative FmdB family regulatory protein